MPQLDEMGTHATSNSDTQLGLTKSEIDLLRYQQHPRAIRGSRVRRQGSFTFQKPSKNIIFYLQLAIFLGHNEIATIFIDMFVNMFADNNSRTNVIEDIKPLFRRYMMSTLLCIAAANGHLKTVQLLLDKGAELDQFSGPEVDILQSCSRGAPFFPFIQPHGNDLLQTPLCAAGAQRADKDKGGMSPLRWAIQSGHNEIVKLLLNYRALFKADESQRARALDLACRSHRTNLALMLLARHSREWTETTDGPIFKLYTLKTIEGFCGADIGRTEIVVWMEVRRCREEMESWMERSA
jgi:ankyrin repeat protein